MRRVWASHTFSSSPQEVASGWPLGAPWPFASAGAFSEYGVPVLPATWFRSCFDLDTKTRSDEDNPEHLLPCLRAQLLADRALADVREPENQRLGGKVGRSPPADIRKRP